MTHPIPPTARAPSATELSALEAADLMSQVLCDIAEELGCENDNEAILLAIHNLKERAHPPAAEREAPGGVVPGWKLVPSEATVPMLQAACYQTTVSHDPDEVARAYEAMLAAAPPPPANIGGDSPRERGLIAEIEDLRRAWNERSSSCRVEAQKVISSAQQLGLLAAPAEGGRDGN